MVGDARQAATTFSFSTDDAPGRAIDIEITPGSRAAPTGPVFTTTHTLVGDRTVPIAAPEDFAVELLGDGTRRFTATPPPNTRVAGYALRYGPADAEATWDALTPLVHGRITALPLETRLPPAGRWRFALAALDRNGVPGTPARIGPVDLPDAVKLPVTQYAFLATSTETPPPGPARGGSTSDTHLPPGWSTTPVSLTAQSPVQWIIERKGRTGGGPWSNWTAPALWSKLGVDGENGTEGEPGRDGADGTDGRDGVDGEPGRDGQDGRDGIDGQDGAGVELIFRRTARNAPPDIPPPVPVATNVIQSRGSWVALFPNDSLPERLEDGFVFRFVAPADQSADQRMTAVEVDIEPLATGWVRNADGSALAPRQMRKGQSYDLRRHNTEWRLIDPPDTRSDYVPPDWSDDPVGVTPAEPYEWVSERRGRAGAWSAFTAPTLWARYARDGAPGRPGTKGNTGARGAQGLQGLPGRDGQDGVGVELIFRRSATNRRPATPRSTADQRQSSDYVPEDWSDDPVGVTPAEPYEWVSERRGRAGAWSAFTAPTLWARYARDGAPGRPGRPGRTGLPGRDGQDGPGLEFIFRLTATPIRPATPRTTAAQRRIDDHVPDNWSDDAPEVSAAMPWLWVSRRKGSSGNWSAFSRPVQWARYARDGRPGADGADGEPGRNGADGRDGRPGTKGDKGDDGARGARGAGTFAQSIPSRGWIDRVANAATPGDTVAGDVVTLFDSAGGWAETRAWDGHAWVPVAHVINGNTVIPGTLLAEAIAAGQIESRHLQADQAVITNGLQLGSGLITVSHLDDTLIGDVARGGRWRLSASRQPSLNRSGAHTANGGLTTPPRSDGGSDIVVRRDHADEIMRYSLTLNLSLSPSNARHVTQARGRDSDEETAGFAYQHGVTLQVEVRIDNVVVTTRQVTYSGKGISHSEKLIEAVLPAHLTPIGQQRRLSVRAGYSVTTEPPKPRYGLGTRRGIVTAWSLNATFTLTARETRPFA